MIEIKKTKRTFIFLKSFFFENIIIKRGKKLISGSARNLINSLILIVAILITLSSINLILAFSMFFGFGFLYLIIIRFTRIQLNENSKQIAEKSTLMIKALQEGLGGIRDILIDGNQEFYSHLYRKADARFRIASANNVFIGASPKFLVETFGLVLIALLAYMLSQREGGIVGYIPLLGVLALGAQRLLPVLQQSFKAYSGIKGAQHSFLDVLDLLDQPLPEYASHSKPKPISFNKNITLYNITYKYQNQNKMVLNKVNLTIKKGERIGIIGETGSGKSTLLDIFMGLLNPVDGKISIDGRLITKENSRAWQAHITHVPQNIFLADASIEENIAFGVPNSLIDHKLVVKVAKKAHLHDLIDDWEDKYQTYIGENGVRLSGGQRQRIGIARALYRESDVIVLDEATSALDNKTEQTVMNEIENLGKNVTLLIIAHRISTLKFCDRIIELGNKDVKIKKYNELS